MNDLQTKEHICNTTKNAADRQEEIVLETTLKALDVQKKYLFSVIHTATLSEKNRRKKDLLINLAVFGSATLIALILFLINIAFGVLFVIIVGVATWLVKQNNTEANAANYRNRKSFFLKYSQHIPENERLKWKR